MKYLVCLALLLFLPCRSQEHHNKFLTSDKGGWKKIVAFFLREREKQNYKACYSLFTENFIKSYKNKYGSDYLEDYDDDSYKAETKIYNSKILNAQISSNSFYTILTVSMLGSRLALDQGEEPEKLTQVFTVVKISNTYLIDSIERKF